MTKCGLPHLNERQGGSMKWYGLVVAGVNYSNDFWQEFDSIRAAKRWLSRAIDDPRLYPCFGEGIYSDSGEEIGPEVLLQSAHPEQGVYPDYRVFIGPRGAVRHERT